MGMKKTYVAKKEDIKRKWFLVDAKDKILGRLASQIAKVLRGKHKPIYTPFIDTGDCVIVINASLIKVTGKKLKDKMYRRYSGYPGGLREETLETVLKNKPTEVLRLAVKRMLPAGPLGRDVFKKLRVYAGPTHPHKIKDLEILEV